MGYWRQQHIINPSELVVLGDWPLDLVIQCLKTNPTILEDGDEFIAYWMQAANDTKTTPVYSKGGVPDTESEAGNIVFHLLADVSHEYMRQLGRPPTSGEIFCLFVLAVNILKSKNPIKARLCAPLPGIRYALEEEKKRDGTKKNSTDKRG